MRHEICHARTFFAYLQIPFVVVSPGPVPRTRQSKLLMIESACETFFYKEDLKDIEKKGYGIVFSFNALNHYCPTIVISKTNYAAWQLEQLAIISMGSLSLINEIDITQLADFQKEHLEVFKEQLNTTEQVFGSTIGTSTATAGAKAIPSGVLFTAVPGVPAEPGSSSSSQAPQSSIDQPIPAHFVSHPPSAKKKKGKWYLCEQCSKILLRKLILMIICQSRIMLEKI